MNIVVMGFPLPLGTSENLGQQNTCYLHPNILMAGPCPHAQY